MDNRLVKMTFYVWGSGAARDSAIRHGVATARALAVARDHWPGFASSEDAWAVEVDGLDEYSLDAATRLDRAVVGWLAAPAEPEGEAP